jgi:putative transposase
MSDRDRTDLALTAKIEAIHRRSKGVYGSPNIHAELADDYGVRVARKRVARLMRAAGLRGATLRRYIVTTQPDLQAPRAVDLVERQFYTDGPDRLWVADITCIPTWSGFLYGDGARCVLAAHCRLVDGGAFAHGADSGGAQYGDHAATTLGGNPSFRSQYTSYAFGKRCREAGVMPSMGSVGDAYDNAMAESFFATLERELLNRRRFKTQAEAKMAVFEWIEGWYNPHRRHSSLGYRSPVNYERAHQRSGEETKSFYRLRRQTALVEDFG